MLRKITDTDVIETCKNCGNRVIPDVCWCGTELKSHSLMTEHTFIPMGCTCGFHTKEIRPTVFFVSTIDMRREFHSRTWIWLPTYKEAESFILLNLTDISEGGTNQWAVIEGIRPIIIDNDVEQTFFELIDTDMGLFYQKIEGWPEPVDAYYKEHLLVRQIATIG